MWANVDKLGNQKGQGQEMEKLLPAALYLLHQFETK